MNKSHLLLFFPLVLVSACAPQAKEVPKTSEGPQAQQVKGPAQEELSRMVKSQQLYYRAQQAFQAKDAKKSLDLLEQGVQAAREEKNIAAAVLCRETQAKMQVSQSDRAGAIKTLESSLAEFDSPAADPPSKIHLDGSKAFLASLYATAGSSDKADALYNKALAAARAEKPVNHQKMAFWLRNYADFFKFKKDAKKCKDLENQAAAELKKAQ